jgi:drug/metabolite transporter (DMT)-like permease
VPIRQGVICYSAASSGIGDEPGDEEETGVAAAPSQPQDMTWLLFALLTVLTWGVYGVFIHRGQLLMADPAHGRFKAFLLVGVAYFLVAVLAPLVVLLLVGASWSFSTGGIVWSLLAGVMGAVGAFGVLLAFGARGSPTVVMAIVFAGAPVVNATVALLTHPPAGGLAAIRPQFYLGILLAALGGFLVTLYKPGPLPAPGEPPATTRQAEPDRPEPPQR